jgi:drug/metabolite transporter (DMT)-like permease
MKSYRFLYHIVALLVASIWGSTFISTKLLLLAGMTAAQIFVLRFAIAYVLLLGYSVYKRHRVFARSWRHELLLAMLGVVGGSLYFLTENNAMNYTTTTNTSIIVSLCPLFASALIGFVYKSQRLNRVQTFGTLLAAAGVVVVVMNGRFVLHLSPIGDTLAFMACLCWAFYSLLMIPASKRYDTVFITRKVFFYGLYP